MSYEQGSDEYAPLQQGGSLGEAAEQSARFRRFGRSRSRELIEDACQAAWTILLRRQPDRSPTLFAWLRTVAVREAYALSHVHHRDASLDEEHHAEHLAVHEPLADQLEARRALRALASLPDRQRRYATLRAGGFSYEEIQQIAGGVTYTNVNKHLAVASARLRQFEQDAA